MKRVDYREALLVTIGCLAFPNASRALFCSRALTSCSKVAVVTQSPSCRRRVGGRNLDNFPRPMVGDIPTVLDFSAIACSSSSISDISNTLWKGGAVSRRGIWTRMTAVSLLACGAGLCNRSRVEARNLPETYANQNTPGSLSALVPIVKLEQELVRLLGDALATTKEGYDRNTVLDCSKKILQSTVIPNQEGPFKALFDAYSEPVSYKTRYMDKNAFLVYYTQGFDGPGRPSIEGQETESEAKQKRQFGARNEAWIAWDEALATALAATTSKGGSTTIGLDDLLEPLEEALKAVRRYLQDAPDSDLELAEKST